MKEQRTLLAAPWLCTLPRGTSPANPILLLIERVKRQDPGFSVGTHPGWVDTHNRILLRAKGTYARLIEVRGLAKTVYPTITPDPTVPAPVVNEYPLLPLPAGLPLLASTESITQAVACQERRPLPEGRRDSPESERSRPWDTSLIGDLSCVDGAQRGDSRRFIGRHAGAQKIRNGDRCDDQDDCHYDQNSISEKPCCFRINLPENPSDISVALQCQTRNRRRVLSH